MSAIIIMLVSVALIVPAIYMIILNRLTRSGPVIEIKELFIEEKIESAGLSWFRWYVLRVEYFVESYKNIYTMMGPDQKSAWFKNQEDAVNALQVIKNIKYSTVTPFGNFLLIDKLSKNRYHHYMTMIISGVILMIISILLMLTGI
jgi:hypothetical protein